MANKIVWSWGYNWSGQIGDGTTDDRSSPVSIGSYSIISGGYDHSLAIDANGMVWAWGSGGNGELGDNSEDDKSLPISVCRSDSYVAIAAGNNFSLAIDSNGMVWAWGYNWAGQIGDESNNDKSSPVSIHRPGSYAAIVADELNTLAIDGSTGMIYAWGFNLFGELGDNTETPRSSPVSICRSGSYVAISIRDHSLAIDGSTGMVYAWGDNRYGQLGIGSGESKSSPVAIARSASYVAIATGGDNYYGSYSLAIDGSDGSIWAWGYNFEGQLGTGTTSDNISSPVSIARAGSYVAISSGDGYSEAIDSNGMVWTWGTGGVLGDGTTNDSSSPVSIIRVNSYAIISAGGYHAFAGIPVTIPWITMSDVLVESFTPITGFYVDLTASTSGEGTTISPYTLAQFVSAYYYCTENTTFYLKNIATVSTNLTVTCSTPNISISLEPWDLSVYGDWGFVATGGATVTISLPS